MPLLDLAELAQQLRSLARDFEALHARVRDVSYTPGTDALRQISPLLLMTQDLTATVLVRLGALDSSTCTSVAGSRANLECLASVVVASSLAGNDLASALHANPYEGAPFPGYPADEASVRTARHAEALPKMTGYLADAAHQLDLSATGCHYVATGITRDLLPAPPPGHRSALYPWPERQRTRALPTPHDHAADFPARPLGVASRYPPAPGRRQAQ
ncbi:hypothetical protein [Streptomyces maremycinicus]|uniref:hypothetical protein n=1 Tax=Streptomyces maremycinicus TaxID=1679753 RepID=UPI000AFCEC4B|nr:hypothetical protein [Streptomyces sp. NBRC 110468]